MEITTEQIEPRQVQLTIVVPAERMEKAMNDLAQAYSKRLKVPGYRPGHVPMRILAGHLDMEKVHEEAVKYVSEDVLREAVEAEGIDPFTNVPVEVVSEDPLTLRALVPLTPTVELGDYHAYLELSDEPPEPVVDAHIEAKLDEWLNDMAVLAPVERAAEAGDTMNLSLVGRYDDEVVFEDEAMSLTLDPDQAIDAGLPGELVDELIGLKAGETHSFGLKYSEYWPTTHLRGRTVGFEAEVMSVLALDVPELDDELAKQVANVDTAEALRTRTGEQLAMRRQIEHNEARVKAAIEALVAQSDVSYPPIAVDQEIAQMLAGLRQRVEEQGFTWERWLELQDKDRDTLWDEAAPEAEARLQRNLVLSAFAKAENIHVTAEEMAAADRYAQNMVNATKDPGTGKVKANPKTKKAVAQMMRDEVISRVLTDRTLDRLVTIAYGLPDETGALTLDDPDDPAMDEPDEQAADEPEAAVVR